jgi:hypothetical protein
MTEAGRRRKTFVLVLRKNQYYWAKLVIQRHLSEVPVRPSGVP